MTDQVEKARSFTGLHTPGKPIKLYNIWDAGSAKAIANSGAVAIATGSWSVAAAQGYPDGQAIPLDLVLQIATRICEAVSVPVTLDFEGGYAERPDDLATHIPRLLKTGVVGINFEDQIIGGQGLFPISEQVARIAAIRQAADKEGIPIFINARTDYFLKERDSQKHGELLSAAKERAEAYRQAGANGFFAPGLTEPSLIQELCSTVALPVNIMWGPGAPSPDDLATMGVGRISCGPQPYRAAMGNLIDQYCQDFG